MSCGESSGPHGIGSAARMTLVRRYEGVVYDSSRWDGFELRPGDIIISTPPKCGTTWTQMICALLILQEPELPLPLDRLSPWIDMVTRARAEVFADLQAQTHRRFIKTHTPLDGLPNDPTVTYISVGRDPRDVAPAHRRAPPDVPRRCRQARRCAPALQRPEGGPGRADAAVGRPPRHRRRRAAMAPPGPRGELRVDAQQGRHHGPQR